MENEIRKINALLSAIFKVLGIIAAIFAFIFLVITLTIYNLKKLDQLGGYIGGILGTICALISVILLYRTYQSQKEELRTTREHIKQQQFEATLFNMLNMINTIGKDMEYNESHSTYSGHKFYIEFMKKFEKLYKYSLGHEDIDSTDRYGRRFFKRINMINPGSPEFTGEFKYDSIINWVKKNKEDAIGEMYRMLFIEFDCQLGNFFRYIFHTIKFIEKERKEYEDEEHYIKLIQSQLSNYQLLVMFYNCLSSFSWNSQKEPKFKSVLDYYNFFQNIPGELLLEPNHYKLYPYTEFKFLSQKEIKRRRSERNYTYKNKPTLN